jgi:hypothetical protein
MHLPSCENEQAVVEAAWSGRCDPRLRAHIAECPVCAEVALVAHWLRQEDESAQAGAQLPKAGQIWWQAQVRSRQEAAQRAVRPIAVAEMVGYGFGILALSAVVAWRWPQVHEWLDRLSGHWTNASVFDHWTAQWNFALTISAAAFLLFIGVAGYLVHTED